MKRFLLFCMAMALSTSVFAQVTTSSMRGVVTDAVSGERMIGATVVAIHTPSGTQYGTVTNVDGAFSIQGMRTGGPYEITTTYVGYTPVKNTDVTLQLGETFNLNVAISEGENIDAVIVSVQGSKFSAEKTGATTNINNEQIMSMPTTSRSIEDIAKFSPYSNGMSFAGGDGRSSNFTVDGANLNNNFGLNDGLPGGGSPISIDALEEIQVVIAPYDVRQTNFIGGGINAVTKSGTNEFKGSAYTYQYNENMRGNTIDGNDLGDRAQDAKHVYGFTLGGPIVKNKLFFFVNGEYEKRPSTVNLWQASEDGERDADNYISATTKEDMQIVKDFLMDNYGYDTGSYTDFPADESTIKLLARIDWNINDAHKLAVRYNYTKNQYWNSPNGSSSDAYSRQSASRMSQYSMAFANSMYSMNNVAKSLSADLNSRLGDNMSNQFLVTYSSLNDVRGTNSEPFVHIDILKDASEGDLTPYMSAGYELFSWNNGVENDVVTVTDNFTYNMGAHKFTAGLSFEYQMAKNTYLRNGTGYYRYASLDDFLNGAAPETVALTTGYDGEAVPAPTVRFHQYGAYVQDEWSPSKDFKLTYGIRFDTIDFYDEDVMRNQTTYELDFGGQHIDTGAWPKANVMFSPRVGFTWDVKGDKTLKLRGGTGIFTGRLPLVFFTNMPSNSGMVQNLTVLSTEYEYEDGVLSITPDAGLENFAGDMITDVKELADALGIPETISPEDGTFQQYITGIDSNFKMPQVWKSSIAVDYQLPTSFPFTATAEFIYNKSINAIVVENINIKDDSVYEYDTFAGSDNRYIYTNDAKYYTDVTSATVLKNTSEGYGYTANITLNAQPVKNLSVMAAYTYTESREISGMPGNNAHSTWTSLPSVNGTNNATLQRSQYVVPNRVIASVAYKIHDLNLSLFYSGQSSYGYSYTYSNDMNGDGITTNDLMYIPANENDIVFVSQDDADRFWAFVEQDAYLSANKGSYAEAYAARAPWLHRFDLRATYDIWLGKRNVAKNKLQLEANLLNAGNLINSSWGVSQTNSACNYGRILKYEGQNEAGNPTFSMGDYTETFTPNKSYGQAWTVQVGARYYFN